MSHPQWPISAINKKSNSTGLAPLHRSAQSNDISGVMFLIQNGADSALHHAVHLDLIEYVSVLLQNGALLNVKDHINLTPIEYCLQKKKVDVFKSIIALIFK